MNQTSLEAYRSIQHTLSGRRAQVYAKLLSGPKSNREIAKLLRWEINCVTGRTRELVKSGHVEAKHKRTGPCKAKETVWGIV